MAEQKEAGASTPPVKPPPSRGQGKTAWVGAFLIVGLLAVLIVLFTMTDAAIFRGRYIIHTYVPDAGGIRRGDSVRMRGVNIGRVMGFQIEIGPQQSVKLDLEIEGEYKIPKDSTVELSSAGALGGMKADIHPGLSPEYVRYGDTLNGKTTLGLLDRSDELAKDAQEVMKRIQNTLDPKAVGDLHGSAAELQKLLTQLTATVAEEREQIRGLSASLRRSSENLEKVTAGPELERSVKRLDSLTGRMDGMATRLDKSSESLAEVMARIQRGEGTLGKMTTDAALYDNLNRAALNMSQASENINKLTEEIRRNPRKYLKLSVF